MLASLFGFKPVFTSIELYKAAAKGDLSMVKACLAYYQTQGKFYDVEDKELCIKVLVEALYRAISEAQYLIGIELLKAGANPAYRHASGNTPFFQNFYFGSKSFTRIIFLLCGTDYYDLQDGYNVSLTQVLARKERRYPGSTAYFKRDVEAFNQIHELTIKANKAEDNFDTVTAAHCYCELANIYLKYSKIEKKETCIIRLDKQDEIADYYLSLANENYKKAQPILLALDEHYKTKDKLTEQERGNYALLLEHLADIALGLNQPADSIRNYSKRSAEMKMPVHITPDNLAQLFRNPLAEGLRRRHTTDPVQENN